MEDPRIRKFARFLIGYSVNLQRGEKILIEVHGREVPLARALIEEAYKAGGKPFLHVFDYKLERALLSGVDDEHMSEIAAYDLARMRDMDAYIDLRATENLSEWNDIPDDKVVAYRKNYLGPVHLKQRCNHTKWTVIRYPNDAMAQLAKMSTEEFEDYYFDACLFDYAKMSKAMHKLAALMERTDKVRILGKGTELELSIKGIPAIVLDGHINIPDGEVYTAPVRDSINGRVAFNTPIPYEGFVYTDIELEFRGGKVVKASANDSARLNKLLDTDPGARYTGEFAFGVHPRIERPIADILFDEKIHGSFHLTP